MGLGGISIISCAGHCRRRERRQPLTGLLGPDNMDCPLAFLRLGIRGTRGALLLPSIHTPRSRMAGKCADPHDRRSLVNAVRLRRCDAPTGACASALSSWLVRYGIWHGVSPCGMGPRLGHHRSAADDDPWSGGNGARRVDSGSAHECASRGLGDYPVCCCPRERVACLWDHG